MDIGYNINHFHYQKSERYNHGVSIFDFDVEGDVKKSTKLINDVDLMEFFYQLNINYFKRKSKIEIYINERIIKLDVSKIGDIAIKCKEENIIIPKNDWMKLSNLFFEDIGKRINVEFQKYGHLFKVDENGLIYKIDE